MDKKKSTKRRKPSKEQLAAGRALEWIVLMGNQSYLNVPHDSVIGIGDKGFERLQNQGLVEEVGNGYRLSLEGRRLYDSILNEYLNYSIKKL